MTFKKTLFCGFPKGQRIYTFLAPYYGEVNGSNGLKVAREVDRSSFVHGSTQTS